MSRQNVEFLRLGYEALHRGDTEAFEAMSRERLDPDLGAYITVCAEQALAEARAKETEPAEAPFVVAAGLREEAIT